MVNTIPAALGPFTNSPTETPTQRPQGASIGQGAACFIHPPPRIHRPTLLHHLLPRHSPVSSSSNSPSADPSSLRRNRAEGGSTNSAPAGSLPHPQSQSQTQPQADPSASQTQARSQALTPLPLVMPDTKLGSTTTRLLLQDTQAHMEKFAARMDALGTHMEQSLREIQMCRAATEGASEKCVADIVDVVYKCQSNFIKKLEASDNMIQTQSDAIHRLSTAYDSLVRLYESHTSLYASQATAIQELQRQQVILIQGVAPLEPLMKCIFPQTENAIFALGARLDDELHKSRDATAQQTTKLADSNRSLGVVETRLSRLEDQFGNVLALLQRLATAPPAIPPEKTPVQNRRKRHVPDDSPPSPEAKRQRIHPDATHRQLTVDFSKGGNDPMNFSSSATSSVPDDSGNSIPLRLRNNARAPAGRRATIAPALPVSGASKRADSSKGMGVSKSALQKEVSALGEPFFAHAKTMEEEAALGRPKRVSAALSDPVDQDLTPALGAKVGRNPNANLNNKRRESVLRQGKENDARAASSNNGPSSSSHKKKANSKKARQSTNAPNVTASPTPSPFVPPPPPQTQTQLDVSQSQILIPVTATSVPSRSATHMLFADPCAAPARETSLLLALDSSQATSQTITQVASQTQATIFAVGADTLIVGESKTEACASASKGQGSGSGTDHSGKAAKQEVMLAAALFPEAYVTSVKPTMFDSYGRPKRYIMLDIEDDDDDGSVVDLLDDMLEG